MIGQIFPGKLAEQRQVKLAVGVHPRDAAEPQDVGARFLHEGRIGAVPGELEREVGFDAGVDLARAAVVDIPAAIGELALQDVLRATALQRLVHFPQPVHEKHVIGAKGAIDHQLADPVAVGLLLAEEVALGEADGLVHLLVSREPGRRFLRDPRQRDDVGGRVTHARGSGRLGGRLRFFAGQSGRCRMVTPL